MAEWLVEEGIGEHRAILIQDNEIIAARLDWPGGLTTGTVENAVLISRVAGSSRGTARFANGEEALVDRLPKAAREGAPFRLEIVRPAMAERGRHKMARAVPSDLSPAPAPTLVQRLAAEGQVARIVRRFPVEGWRELIADAMHGEVAFRGGSLQFSPTPALLLVDVDGTLPPRELSLAAVPALASAIRRFDAGGSIGIDFPTLESKADRRAVDDALGQALSGWPHERTAMNGFGFVQLVARMQRPSILHRALMERSGMAARLLLRQGEMLEGTGAVLLTSHPAVDALLSEQWIAELSRRTGREIRHKADPALAISSPQAQLVPR